MATGKIQKTPHIEGGYVSEEVPSNDRTVISVNFTTAYSSEPSVAFSLFNSGASSADAHTKYGASISGVSSTGFSVRLYNSSTAARTLGVYWIAVDKTQ